MINFVFQEEEQEDSADRLVIDESGDGDGARSRGENEDDQNSEDVPECQGCHQRAAQFVCAGCGNQWYCSRDCQVQISASHIQNNNKYVKKKERERHLSG